MCLPACHLHLGRLTSRRHFPGFHEEAAAFLLESRSVKGIVVDTLNLARDLGEQTDLAAKEPGRVLELRAELAAWQRQVGARFPTPNPNYAATLPSGRAANRPGNPPTSR